jgi:phosphotriesterase-related protein
MKITTVLGDIDPQDLGFCQSHEHIWIEPGRGSSPEPVPGIDNEEKSLEELKTYRAAGGSAIVDAQPLGCGRNASMLAELSRKSGIHIIASTGFHKLVYYPEDHWIFSTSAGELARLWTSELEEGMYLDGDIALPVKRSGSRPGQFKAALDTVFSAAYRKCFEAACTAVKAAACPLMVHIEKNSDPVALANFLEKQGVPPNRTVFCHLDRAIADINIHRELAGRGINLEYDTIARPKYHGDGREVEIILSMLEAGFERQILLSLDTTRGRLRGYGGSPGLDYILKKFIPLLRSQGVAEARIRLFFWENPAAVFGSGEMALYR